MSICVHWLYRNAFKAFRKQKEQYEPYFILICSFKCFGVQSSIIYSDKTSVKET